MNEYEGLLSDEDGGTVEPWLPLQSESFAEASLFYLSKSGDLASLKPPIFGGTIKDWLPLRMNRSGREVYWLVGAVPLMCMALAFVCLCFMRYRFYKQQRDLLKALLHRSTG